MLSKYEETSVNVIRIEDVVGKLIEELGDGGFMGIKDITAGMKVSLFVSGDRSQKEYTAEVTGVSEHHIYLGDITSDGESLDIKDKSKSYDLSIIVHNALYKWQNIRITPSKQSGLGRNCISIKGNPKVYNRRKYPRLQIHNRCKIAFKDKSGSFDGRMLDISANGFAFSTYAKEFKNSKEKLVTLTINDFEPVAGKPIDGSVIRVSDHNGELIVGVRMLEDSKTLKEYINKKVQK
jgi:methyl-accepting chemotaxis protein